MTQLAEFKNANEFNNWMKNNHDSIEVIEIKYVGNRYYGTSILLIYEKSE